MKDVGLDCGGRRMIIEGLLFTIALFFITLAIMGIISAYKDNKILNELDVSKGDDGE